jgi:polyhydroxyalkanoate synthesis regulator phasin
MNETNLNRLGRKPVFTRHAGFLMLENRKLFGDDRLTVDQFIEQMVAAGELKEACSRATMHRLLTGQMFPDLCTFTKEGIETEVPYEYKDVPMCPSGRAPKADRAEFLRSLKPRLTKGQQKLVDEIKEQTEAHVATRVELLVQRYLENANTRIAALEAEVADLRKTKQDVPNPCGPLPLGA